MLSINVIVRVVMVSLLIACTVATPLRAQTVSNAGFAYPSDTPEIYFQFEAESAGKFTSTLYVVNVGDIVPAGYEMATISLTGEPSEVLNYTYLAPANGWPVGIYRIVVNRDGEPVHESDFHVFAAPDSTPTATPESSPAPPGGVIIND